ncbi:uncharacterized protein [Physeter macrocephalus]|uniref:Uncharacterized protein isoform X4 n=1 Tax=Physeter macrocephalus TaxID=9755 RepID=A0A9W2WRU4_PHYMC|nr:uncharacterized protein LOC114486557 isoform X4 [Physeter catodon]XP_054941853.1 uncharacterized protein LOC114486557 isoform X4 [Physeter catodon]
MAGRTHRLEQWLLSRHDLAPPRDISEGLEPLLIGKLYICSGSPLWWLEWTRQGCCTVGSTWRPKGPRGGLKFSERGDSDTKRHTSNVYTDKSLSEGTRRRRSSSSQGERPQEKPSL